jgi:hypothetical protein
VTGVHRVIDDRHWLHCRVRIVLGHVACHTRPQRRHDERDRSEQTSCTAKEMTFHG